MRLHRFLLNQPIGEAKDITITDTDLLHQWKNVFRFTTGTRLILFDNSGFEYLGLIARLSNLEGKVKIVNKEDRQAVSYPEICLFAALIKKDHFEWVIEKATELGVSQIVPVVTDRSEKKSLNMERANKILKEASEQSGRAKMPKLNEPTAFEEILSSIEVGDEEKIKILSIDPKGEAWPKADKFDTKLGAFVGPEGGWSPRELQLFKLKKIPIYRLGSQVLRAETAAVALLSLLTLG